uniref:Uncharacterized protein n=1 Tax=Triticum urartu TaxID=4572 RepID=A0A8R7PDE4_TRIUA
MRRPSLTSRSSRTPGTARATSSCRARLRWRAGRGTAWGGSSLSLSPSPTTPSTAPALQVHVYQAEYASTCTPHRVCSFQSNFLVSTSACSVPSIHVYSSYMLARLDHSLTVCLHSMLSFSCS